MTIILAVVLVIFYLYITLFLFFIHSAKDMAIMTETLYWQEGQRDNSKEKLVVHVAGDKKTIQSQIVMKNLSKNLEVHRYNDSPIENIRRWQLATDTILQRGTP